MKKLIFAFSLLFLIVLSSSAFAAQVEIKGVVLDAKTGDPLPGANVFIQGTKIGAASDLNGKFAFAYETNKEFVLVVRFMGYKTQERRFKPTDNLSNLKFRMKEDVFRGETVVVTGIASKRAKSVAEVAVSRVPAAELTVTNSYQDLSQMVTGKIAGVYVKPASGNVGGGIRFNVRSGGGLNGQEQPLIIVDGVRIDNSSVTGWGVGGQDMSALSDLNPEDIQSIEVLKGPAGAATYGTNGSNGVILITTKRGKLVAGKHKGISFDYKMVTGYNQQSHKYTGDEFITSDDVNAIFRNGKIQQNTLNAYGGVGMIKYFVGLDRRYEDGIIPNNHMDRTTFRANLDVYPSDKFTLNVSSSYMLNENQRPNNDNNIFGFLGNTILLPKPYQFCDSLSVLGLQTIARPNRFLGSIQAHWMPIKNFEAKVSIGLDDGTMRDNKIYPSNLYYSFYPSGDINIWNRRNKQITYDFGAQYTYSPLVGLNITSAVGAQLFNRKNRTFYVSKKDFLTELITNIGSGATYESADETYLHTRQAGIYTNHSFSYLDQYFLTFSLRKDYASSIGPEAPSVLYPGVSFAWRLDKYNFFPSMFGLMKLRAAYGESGLLPGRVDGIPLLWRAQPSGYGAGAVLANIGNEKIKPERIKEMEVGVETEFFTNYSVEFTYYRQKAKDSIIMFRNAPSTGKIASAVPYNVGAIDGWGWESLIQARPLNMRNFQLDMSLTFSHQNNEVKDLGGAQPIFDAFDMNVYKEGLAKHAFYTYKVKGALFNEDGTYKGPDVDKERSYCGTPIPKYNGSFGLNLRLFRNFRINVLTEWALGHSVMNMTKQFAVYLGDAFGMGANNKEYRELQDKLGIINPYTGTPYDWYDNINPLTVGSAAYKEAADRYAKLDRHWDSNFIEKADYFKIGEISVSYSFKDLIPKVYKTKLIKDLILGVSARNVWTTSKYSGADVEVNMRGSRDLGRGQDFLTLQNPKVINAWLRVSL